MKYLPLVWAALWRNRMESVLMLLASSVAFALLGTMVMLNAAYKRAIDDTRMDRLIVACAFDCGVIPLGYREQLLHIPHVTAVGGQLWLGGHEQDERHPITVMFVDQHLRSAWPEMLLSAEDWRSLDATPAGIFLTRTAAARRNVRVGDTVTMNNGPGGTVDGSGTWQSRSSVSSPTRRVGGRVPVVRWGLRIPSSGTYATSKIGVALTSGISLT